jgi:hypothetical protein
MYKDRIPSPTTHNLKMLVQQKTGSPIMKVPYGGRFVALRERGRVMGFDVGDTFSLMESVMTPRQMCRGFGNAIIVPVATSILGGYLDYLSAVMQHMHETPLLVERPLFRASDLRRARPLESEEVDETGDVKFEEVD